MGGGRRKELFVAHSMYAWVRLAVVPRRGARRRAVRRGGVRVRDKPSTVVDAIFKDFWHWQEKISVFAKTVILNFGYLRRLEFRMGRPFGREEDGAVGLQKKKIRFKGRLR